MKYRLITVVNICKKNGISNLNERRLLESAIQNKKLNFISFYDTIL